MRLASWNLADRGEGSPAKWAYLRSLAVDIALVQEAVPPPSVHSVHRASGIAGRDGKERRWGSAVADVAGTHDLRPVGLAEGRWRGRALGVAPIDAVSRGHTAIATTGAGKAPLTLISAYGLLEFGYASGTMLRLVADLEPLLDDPDLGQNVVLAGDWNIGTWWGGADAKYARREAALFDLLAAYGLVDCLTPHIPAGRGRLDGCPCAHGPDCTHLWTHRKAGSDTPYMDDYLFATSAVADRIVRAGPVPDWDWSLSDHVPLVADLDWD